ncbi:phage tail protein [Pseudomonas sp. CAN2814]|uniref:phage tail-collar fiber domain-containing protein n=1 Tax=Pseudomonas sp. CAN1 TaxID=3046726 RepID=UPI002648E099|nr:phage tail protein [Pseudomonas sp. CAN1]MDN6856724.1 phage tail protein [Pseudomonas sp. CAN1]
MAVTYYALLTTIGAGKLANATALGTTLRITQLAVGDGGGNVPAPDASRTQLVNEVRRAPLNRLSVDPANSAQIIAEQVIPEDVGGWWIREMGLYDEAGALIAYANCAPSYKPQLAEGSGRTQTVRIVLIVSNAASVELKIDPSVVLATREYVDSAIVSAMNRLDCKQSVRVATTASITLSGLQTLDGIVLVAGDRVLVKNQSNAADNGIYVAATNAWKRSTDADENSEVTPGLTVVVESGTSQADSIWQLVTDGAIVLGTTALAFQNITNGLARLASPAFTGNPTAPTQDVSDNDTSLATTAFVRNAMAAYGIATSALSPQVADFDDVSLASGLYYVPATATGGPLASQGGLIHRIYGAGGFQIFMMYSSDRAWIRRRGTSTWGPWREVAFLDSPTFTGTPAAPTPPRGDGTTKLATTAYVQDALTSSGLASSGSGESPTDAAGLATLKSGMYYLTSNVSPYPNYAFMMRMSYSGNRGFELANVPYTDRFFGRSSNNDGTWRAPVELAKLDSPALSGAPTAPTPNAGNNSQQLATTAFIQSAIAPLATLISPALSGNPTAPTAAQFDSDTSLATTAFVQRALGSLSGFVTYSASNVWLTNSDLGKYVYCTTNGMTVTLPDATKAPAGSRVYVQAAAGITSISVNNVNGNLSGTNDRTVGTDFIGLLGDTSCEFICSGTNWFATGGSGASSLTSNGYLKFPNGLIVQWCTSEMVAAGKTGLVAWPMVFPVAALWAIAAPVASAPNAAAGNVVVGTLSTNGAGLHNWGVIDAPARILAIGC